jgi:hypothetical protein
MRIRKQLYWDNVQVGEEITPLSKIATTVMLVKWAGASGDMNPLHYDHDFALSQKMQKPIVQGQLKRAWLIQMITDWIGINSDIKKFSIQYKAVDYPRSMKAMDQPEDGETWLCKGKVTKKYEQDGNHLIDCEVWVENGKNEKTTVGAATIKLPTFS